MAVQSTLGWQQIVIRESVFFSVIGKQQAYTNTDKKVTPQTINEHVNRRVLRPCNSQRLNMLQLWV
jgi:hypothetical protein